MVIFRETKTGSYYVSRIRTEAEYLYNEADNIHFTNHISWGCKVEEWLRIDNLTELPANVMGKFSQSRQNTVCEVKTQELKQAIAMLYLRKKYEDDEERKELYRQTPIVVNHANFALCLDYSLLENLVYLYMKDLPENSNYIIWPSFWRKGFQKFEFFMKNENNEFITCQVKNQSSNFPKASEYKNNTDFKRIYLFNGKWASDLEEMADYISDAQSSGVTNVEIIYPNKLFVTLKRYHMLFEDDYFMLDFSRK